MKMTARCKVCHREMSNPAHIAQGMGPVCAARLAAKAVLSERRMERAYYPVERYERIVRACERLAEMGLRAARYLAQERGGVNEADAAWQLALITHWYKRAERMERRARRLLAPHAA